MWHGLLVINKERGLTSHQVVADLRRMIHQTELGHTGTLDPEATGVLVVGLGQATRSFPYLDEKIKIYRAEIVFGRATDTQDETGISTVDFPGMLLAREELEEAIEFFSGSIEQIPPMYSAVKVNGRKLYELARKGEIIDRPSRLITVHNWRFLGIKPDYRYLDRVEAEITCSKGTYIRTLIHDLGERLGCGAHMGRLVRLQAGAFRLEDSFLLSQVRDYYQQGRLNEILIPIAKALDHLPLLRVDADDEKKVRNGGKLSFGKYRLSIETGALARVLDSDSNAAAIVQLVDAESHCFWQPVKVFHY